MNEQAALLRHINENPCDDTARLVYADWLEEHAEPIHRERAEVIRAQFQLEELPLWEPKRHVLRATAERLLGKNRLHWLDPIIWSGKSPVFRRGFIEEVRLPARGVEIDSLEQSLHEFPIRTLLGWQTNRGGYVESIGEMRSLLDVLARMETQERWQQIDQFDFEIPTSFAGLTIPWRAGKYPHLRTVRLPWLAGPAEPILSTLTGVQELRAVLNDDDLRVLVRQNRRERLKVLDLSASRFTLAGWRSLLNSKLLNRVETFRVNSTYQRFGYDAYRELAQCPALGKMTTLSLRGNWIDEAGSLAIINSNSFESLTDLDLSDNDIYDQNMKALASCEGLSRLRSFSLVHNGIRDVGARALAKSNHGKNLEHFDLRDNRIGDEGLKSLCREGAFPRLRSLNLLQNPLTSTGLLSLARSELGAQLEELSIYVETVDAEVWKAWFADGDSKLIRLRLHTGSLGVEAIRALSKVPFPPGLIELDLNRSGVTKEALLELAKMPQLQQLSVLNLHANPIDDAEVQVLVKSPYISNLHTLKIGGYIRRPLQNATLKAIVSSSHLTHLNTLQIQLPVRRKPSPLDAQLQRRFGDLTPRV
jgi:uncharacterized protein (TIGR02996 family)